MTLILDLPAKDEAALKAKAQAQGVSVEQYTERLISRDLVEKGKRPLSAAIRELWSDMPEEARAKLAADGASQVDHYIYGVPKRDQ